MKYRRLPGKKRGICRWRTLWLGDDHLLSVDSNGYSEDYTRYYFKDARALFSRRTVTGKVLNFLFAAGLTVSLVTLLASLGDGVTSGSVTLAILSALFLALLVINILRGPTCRCHILMPLGIHELPTLRRMRTARRVIDLVRPRILGIQSTLEPAAAPVVVATPASVAISPGQAAP